jgi:hypothetical protein
MLVLGGADLPVCKVNSTLISYDRRPTAGNEVYNLEEGDKLTLNTIAPDGQRHCFFVIGSSGTGKTTFCASYAKTYLKEHGEGYHVVLICSDRDRVFDGFPQFLHLTPGDVIRRDVKVKDLPKSLIIFDDVGSIADKQESKAVYALANECLERSRKFEGDIMFISHSGSNYTQTKAITIECNYVWFNLDDVNSNLMYTLTKFGIAKKVLEKFIKNKTSFGRWIVFRVNSSPRYIVSPLRVATFDELTLM